MQNAIVLNQKDVKDALAKLYKVPVENVMNTKYSYVITLNDANKEGEKKDNE